MPTRNESMEFVRKHKKVLREAGLKAPSTMKSGDLNQAIDKAVEKTSKSIANEWKKMKLIKDSSPMKQASTLKSLKREALKKGKPMGQGVDLSKRQTMKKDSIKAGGSY
tara:strand:+ start:186 stop:512 length:327 start_codon:yes stop_codon:yes gene_type:complete